MRKRTPYAAFAGILLLLVTLTACGAKDKAPPTESAPPVQTEQLPVPEETTAAATEPEKLPYIPVSTPFGDLYYQSLWEDDMIVEQETTGDSAKVSFSTRINDQQYDLFCIVIGSAEGTLVGELTDPTGVKREVYASMATLPDLSGLASDEQVRLYAMQEDINYVIQNLK